MRIDVATPPTNQSIRKPTLAIAPTAEAEKVPTHIERMTSTNASHQMRYEPENRLLNVEKSIVLGEQHFSGQPASNSSSAEGITLSTNVYPRKSARQKESFREKFGFFSNETELNCGYELIRSLALFSLASYMPRLGGAILLYSLLRDRVFTLEPQLHQAIDLRDGLEQNGFYQLALPDDFDPDIDFHNLRDYLDNMANERLPGYETIGYRLEACGRSPGFTWHNDVASTQINIATKHKTYSAVVYRQPGPTLLVSPASHKRKNLFFLPSPIQLSSERPTSIVIFDTELYHAGGVSANLDGNRRMLQMKLIHKEDLDNPAVLELGKTNKYERHEAHFSIPSRDASNSISKFRIQLEQLGNCLKYAFASEVLRFTRLSAPLYQLEFFRDSVAFPTDFGFVERIAKGLGIEARAADFNPKKKLHKN